MIRLALALVVAGLSGPALSEGCAPDVVSLKGPGGQARFTVEIADDAAERAQGLMNRPEMATSHGMLFVYGHPQPVAFWMENTLIPLDMLFIGADGVVTRVHANAKPLDRTPIPGGDAVQFVLEINGGLAKRLGLEVGSVMRSPYVDQSRAAWSCD